MRGAAPKAIQDLAGHQDLTTTQRYMHRTPSAAEAAIRLLDSTSEEAHGNRLAAGSSEVANSSR